MRNRERWRWIVSRVLLVALAIVMWVQGSTLAKAGELDAAPLSDPQLARVEKLLVGADPKRTSIVLRSMATERRLLHAEAEAWRCLLEQSGRSSRRNAVGVSLVLILLLLERRIGGERVS